MAAVSDLVVATAQVKGGRLFINHRSLFNRQIAQLDERWQLEVTVSRLRATRSIEANKFYWSQVVGLVAAHTGYTPDEIHEIYKAKFIPKTLSLADGNGEIVGNFVLGGSTRGMNVQDFYRFIESIREWAAETLDVIIPDPDPAWRAHVD